MIVRELGRGGMGSIFLARDRRLAREVAIKIILPTRLDSDARRSFLQEARLLAGVRHPNVVQVHSFGDHQGLPFFVMEYVPGETLADWLDAHLRVGVLPELDAALSILDQISRGLGAIHEAGIIHGDVKPGNILLGPAMRVAVADFGVVRRKGEAIDDPRFYGTPGYIAPELLTPSPPQPSLSIDVFALGVTAYELLTGKLPFGQDPGARGPIRPSRLRPGLPSLFDDVLLRALATKPADRPADASVLRQALFGARQSMMMPAFKRRFLVADADPEALEQTADALAAGFLGAAIETASTGPAAIEYLDAGELDLIVVDLQLPEVNGLELVAYARGGGVNQHVPILVTTDTGNAADWRLLQSVGAQGLLLRPYDEEALLSTARRALSKSQVGRA